MLDLHPGQPAIVTHDTGEGDDRADIPRAPSEHRNLGCEIERRGPNSNLHP
jgi:hypothetical protein